MTLTSEDRVTRARCGAYALHNLYDSKLTTLHGRQAFLQRFVDAIPADLPPDERRRRAAFGLKAHMTRLSFYSARARRRRQRKGDGK
jgi:hypothetical protein